MKFNVLSRKHIIETLENDESNLREDQRDKRKLNGEWKVIGLSLEFINQTLNHNYVQLLD